MAASYVVASNQPNQKLGFSKLEFNFEMLPVKLPDAEIGQFWSTGRLYSYLQPDSTIYHQ